MKDIVSEHLTDPQSLRRKSGLVVVDRSTIPTRPSPTRRLPRLRDLASSPVAMRTTQRVRPVAAGRRKKEFNSTI